MHWAFPDYWYWWGLAPAAVGWVLWSFVHRRRLLARFAAPALWPSLADAVDGAARRCKAALVVVGLLCLLVALVGPQWGFHWQEVKRRGVDLVIALDVSKSMLAEDVKPNRLGRATLAIQELIPQLGGDRLGLVVFAGTSFLTCPLTVDYGGFATMLEDVSPDLIPRGGTDLASAIRTGLHALNASAAGSRALVLITDGEDHDSDPMAAAAEAAKSGTKIFCIGIGTAEGELIPRTDADGHRTFVQDRAGRTVQSRLDEPLLQRIALSTGGGYVRATATAFGLDLIYRERIAKLERRTQDSTLQQRYEHRYQWPLALGFLLLGVEPLISDRRRKGSMT